MLISALILAGTFVGTMGAVAVFAKDDNKIIQPTITNINNSFNNTTTHCSTSSNIKTKESTNVKLDDEKIIEELSERYKIDKELDDLLEKIRNLNK